MPTNTLSRRSLLFLLAPLLLLLLLAARPAGGSIGESGGASAAAVEAAEAAEDASGSRRGDCDRDDTCAAEEAQVTSKTDGGPGEHEHKHEHEGKKSTEEEATSADEDKVEEEGEEEGEEEEEEEEEEEDSEDDESEDSEDSSEDSEDWEDWEEEDEDEIEIEIDSGVPQVLEDELQHLRSKFDAYIAHMERYMRYGVADSDDEELAAVLPRCKNMIKECVQWAMEGACETETTFMWIKCAPACHSCEKLIYERRCPYEPRLLPAWRRGELNEMFERIVSDEAYAKYEPRVWSRPTLAEGDEEGTAEYLVGGPWIITLENVLTEAEADRIIELGDEKGFKRSDDDGEYLEDGSFVTKHTDGRTSYNTWCIACHDDEHGSAVLEKIEHITHIPRKHFANLQILRYEKTQKYEVHHDYDKYSVPRQPGPRILTFFLYLSDVEEGGGTDFPRLNLTFYPKKGRALLWPNVLDELPGRWDERTHHQALPVVKGTKYAANAWIHQFDFQGPSSRNCAD